MQTSGQHWSYVWLWLLRHWTRGLPPGDFLVQAHMEGPAVRLVEVEVQL